jgi:hypothetical protein
LTSENDRKLWLLTVLVSVCLLVFPRALGIAYAAEVAGEASKVAERSYLQQLLPVALGGLIGLVGSIGGGFLIFNLQSRKERKVFLRGKREELLALAYGCDEWLDQLTLGYLVQGDIGAVLDKFPVNKMKMLQVLYFPALKNTLDSLDEAVKESRTGIILERNNLSKTRSYSEEFRKAFDARRARVLSALEDLAQQASGLKM